MHPVISQSTHTKKRSAGAVNLHLNPPNRPVTADDSPERLADIDEIEVCHSIAGDMSYILRSRWGV